MTKRLMITLAALAMAGFALAACGEDSADSSSSSEAEAPATTSSSAGRAGGGSTIKISADPSGALKFTETEVSAAAGPVTVGLDNPSSTPHSLYIEDADGNVITEVETISSHTATATADLEAATYTFYCSEPGHREAGMEGTLTVE